MKDWCEHNSHRGDITFQPPSDTVKWLLDLPLEPDSEMLIGDDYEKRKGDWSEDASYIISSNVLKPVAIMGSRLKSGKENRGLATYIGLEQAKID